MKKGFTLIEMVLVMAVLVVIFLLTIPNVTKTMRVVNDKGCDAQVKVVDSAILQFKLEYDRYPNDISEVVNSGFISNRQTNCSDGTPIRIIDGHAQK